MLESWDKEECKVGMCDRCSKDNTDVIADGYTVGFLCEDCYKFVYAMD